MQPYYEDDQVTLHLGDSLEVLRLLPGNSVDAVVCDPPYGLAELPAAVVIAALTAWLTGDREHVPDGRGFMGNDWDRFVPPPALWDECYRVLKPGGHLLAFAGSRTGDLMGMSIRLANFEIRDGIDWLYGSGFPKSLDVSKAIDKTARGEMVRAKLLHFATARGINGRWLEAQGVASAASFTDWTVGGHVPSDRNWQLVKTALAVTVDEEAAFERAVVGQRTSGATAGMQQLGPSGIKGGEYAVTAPATDDARRWEGWGTALKPAREPIVMARKPLAGTVAANVLTYGTGALNIDASRIAHASDADLAVSLAKNPGRSDLVTSGTYGSDRPQQSVNTAGRWPTNVVLSHAGNDVDGDLCADGCVPGCPVAELDRQSGVTRSPLGGSTQRELTSRGYKGGGLGQRRSTDHELIDGVTKPGYADEGGASRFFPVFRYEAKAPTSERPKVDGEAHATVKPLALMRWLVQLVTPPGGTVLEPFAGSGTTVEACLIEGYRCIAVEKEAKYLPLIMSRISKPIEPVLFGALDECEGAP